MHVDDTVLAPLRRRYGPPATLRWSGDVSEAEYRIATYNPARTHDVTLFILDPDDRIALIQKHHFPPDIWRPPGGGIKPGEDFADGAVREALEETGLHVALERYLVAADALFRWDGHELAWRTHVFLARTDDRTPEPRDAAEIAAARFVTLAELAGPLRARLLATGRALWRYRVALHDASLSALGS